MRQLQHRKSIKDGLSVQYFVSNYPNGMGICACCGGPPARLPIFTHYAYAYKEGING